jgi:plastocyanin
VTVRSRGVALTATLLLAFVLPAVAQARIKVVDMGLPKNVQKTFFGRYQSDVNDFFPHGVTINAGDIVRFVPTGFHTVDIPPRGGKPLPLLTPVGKKVAGANDAAGTGFWFNGQPQLGFTPALLKGAFGKHLGYNGSRRIESGLPIQRHPKSFFVRFARPGSYTYYCNVHPGMKGVVRVLPKRRPAPSAGVDARVLKVQVADDLKVAKALRATKPPAGVVDVGAAGRHGVESFAFFPQTLTVPVGTTLRFTMTKRSFEEHTATTGPGNPEREPSSYLGKLAASFNAPAFDPAAIFPTDPPGPPAKLTPTSHGNGFWNSGVLDSSPATPLPASQAVTFAAAGTYQFYCLLHPFMHATVVVQ